MDEIGNLLITEDPTNGEYTYWFILCEEADGVHLTIRFMGTDIRGASIGWPIPTK